MSYFNSRQLLRRAHSELDAAHLQSSPREQFLHAHMAALRGAAAVLAINPAVVSPARRKVRSAWVQLAEAGEEWGPWVEFYLASAATRAALESGQLREIDASNAREAARAAGQFLAAVEEHIARHEAEFAALATAS